MTSWFSLLESARSPLQVVSVARDYLAEWTPQELARLPERCRPGKLRDEQDIEDLHSKLVEEYRNTGASGEELATIQQLTSFLVRASIRIAELEASPPGGGSGDPDSESGNSASPS
jgi:hypothetical protein